MVSGHTCNTTINMQASGDMADATRTTLPPGAAGGVPTAVRAVVVAVAAAAVAALLIRRWLELDAAFLWSVVVLAPLCGVVLVVLSATRAQGAPFGRASEVTLARGALALLLLGMLAAEPSAAVAWLAVLLALAGLGLDGLDGWLARERGEASAFGARFDMETDAVMLLALAALAWQQGKAGPWILLAGALRYAFVASGAALPWLERPLPPSRRRQTICVLQIVALIGCLAPLVGRPAANAVAAAGVVLLVWSFAIDVTWLARHRSGPQ